MQESPTVQVLADVRVEVSSDPAERADVLTLVLRAMVDPAITCEVGPMSTLISGELGSVVHAVQRGHAVAVDHAARVVTDVRIETRAPALTLEERRAEAAALTEALEG